MARQETIDIIEKEKIVVIIRLKEQNDVEKVIDTLVEGGVKVLEVTSNTPGYAPEIKKARAKYPDILIGAGTILNPALAIEAIEAGAQFLVTPNTNTQVITTAHQYDIPVMMGALTPTEIATAVNGGADVIKLFPASNFGIPYFKGIRAVYNKVPFYAVGGVRLDDFEDWIAAGAKGAGIGGSLIYPINSIEDSKRMKKEIGAYLELTRAL